MHVCHRPVANMKVITPRTMEPATRAGRLDMLPSAASSWPEKNAAVSARATAASMVAGSPAAADRSGAG